MRFAPTSALWSAAVIALALVGCATDNGDVDDDDPAAVPATNDATGAGEKKSEEARKPGSRPDFDPQFEQGTPDDEEADDPSKDPTPPGGADQCIDTDDPGSSPNLAKKLPDTDDCNQDILSVSGVMNGGVDVDWYSLSATDRGISFDHPVGCKLDTTFETKTAGTELCVFARCKNSTDNAVSGCAAGTPTTAENGLKGCCGAAPGNGKAIPQWDCAGFTDNDSADFFLRVRQTNNGEKCLPYKIEYRY
ncbi:MAG: hypothetical protein KIT84_10295 [Labilithrix sp.]|nr:hypothetical protein [Labilithrix sp.]MCW5811394.1 hypothetical protein [Labilithrix sp.]